MSTSTAETTKQKFEIRHRLTGAILWTGDAASIKEAVEMAAKSGSDLSDSNLSGSNLRGSDLRGSNLSGSNLRGSSLRDSDLSGSDLSGSDLTFIHGSKHDTYIHHAGQICIGCISNTIEWWRKNRVACGGREGYTPAQIEEYGHYIELAAKLIESHKGSE